MIVQHKEHKFNIILILQEIRFVLTLHYNGSNNLLVNTVKKHQLKAKDSEIKPYPLCFGNIKITINNIKKRGKRMCKLA